MRLINDDRRRRVSFLAKRLEDFASARTALLLQLEALDAQASVAQMEHNTLHNLDAPISSIPDEVLAMIFEQGMHPRDLSNHFGMLVSHVTQHWRNISIATPKLWTSIQCITEDDDPPYPEILTERVSTFLSRARSSPLDICIKGFREEDLSANFLQLISDHIGHCRQLRILHGEHDSLMTLLEYTSSLPMPLLASLELGHADADPLEFDKQLFLSGVPRLATASLDFVDVLTMQLCLPAFETLTSLELKRLMIVNSDDDTVYSCFRDALMAMPLLHHLDLSIEHFDTSPGRLPILLPRIEHLRVHRDGHMSNPVPLSSFLHFIPAASLSALSLSNWRDRELLELLTDASGPHFPSLQHLILANFSNSVRHLTALAQAFPGIERLTFKPVSTTNRSLLDINRVLDTFLCGAGDDDIAENDDLLWPQIQSIALSAPIERFAAPQLKSKILQLQAAGHPIRKLLLSRDVHPAMEEVRGIIELEEFYVDWPTPFDWEM